MKVRIEIDAGLPEGEIVLRCREPGDAVRRLERLLAGQPDAAPPAMAFYKDGEEVFLPVDRILFFETGGDKVWAHTADDTYRTDLRLYELIEQLPAQFMRVSKSTLLNIRHIFSIQRNLTASSPVLFHNTHKKVYVSRLYYKELRKRLDERGKHHAK